MEKGWTKIYATSEMYKAELIKNLLEHNGIGAVILNKKDSSYIMIGEAEVYVKQDDVLRALNLINKEDNE